jgi:hypothetical protein
VECSEPDQHKISERALQMAQSSFNRNVSSLQNVALVSLSLKLDFLILSKYLPMSKRLRRKATRMFEVEKVKFKALIDKKPT